MTPAQLALTQCYNATSFRRLCGTGTHSCRKLRSSANYPFITVLGCFQRGLGVGAGEWAGTSDSTTKRFETRSVALVQLHPCDVSGTFLHSISISFQLMLRNIFTALTICAWISPPLTKGTARPYAGAFRVKHVHTHDSFVSKTNCIQLRSSFGNLGALECKSLRGAPAVSVLGISVSREPDISVAGTPTDWRLPDK